MKSLKNKFISQIFTYLAFGFLNKSIPFFLLPILTRFLGASDYGIIAMFMTFVSAVTIFLGLSGNSAAGIYYFRMEREQFKLFLGNIFVIWFYSTMVILIFVYFFGESLYSLMSIESNWLLLGVILVSAQFVTSLNLKLWQCERKAKTFGVYQLLQTVGSICLTLILVVYLGMGWEGRLASIVVAELFFACISFYILVGRDSVKWEVSRDYIKESLYFGAPFIPFQLASWGMASLVPLLITRIKGLSSTGIYWVSHQVGYIVFIFATECMRAYVPHIFEKLKTPTEENKKQIVKLTYLCFVAILVLAIMLGLISYHFLHVFLGPDFNDAASLVAWLALGQAFSGMQSMLSQFILYEKKTSWLSVLMSGAILVHAPLCYFLITVKGVLGATQAITVSYFILFVVTWALVMKIYKLPWVIFFRAD